MVKLTLLSIPHADDDRPYHTTINRRDDGLVGALARQSLDCGLLSIGAGPNAKCQQVRLSLEQYSLILYSHRRISLDVVVLYYQRLLVPNDAYIP